MEGLVEGSVISVLGYLVSWVYKKVIGPKRNCRLSHHLGKASVSTWSHLYMFICNSPRYEGSATAIP